MVELITLRTETSKTFDLGGTKCQLVISGVQHYKNDYADKSELWKDIDLTFINRRIDKAPYILEVNGFTVTLTSKRTGTVQTLTLDKMGAAKVSKPAFVFSGNTATWKDAALDTDIVIEAWDSGVRFKRILKSKNAPLEAEYTHSKVIGTADDILLPTSARDADGQPLEISKTDISGVLTETLDSKVDLSKVKYPIEIDPSPLIVGAGKDNYIVQSAANSNYSSSSTFFLNNRASFLIRAILEFDISGIPTGQTLTSASLQLYYCYDSNSSSSGITVWAYKQIRTNWVEAKSTWNAANDDDLDGVNDAGDIFWTTAGGDYVTSSPVGGSTTFPASYDWVSWNVLAICQNAYAGAIPAEFLLKFETEGLSSGYSKPNFFSKEYTTDTSLRPKLTIAYEAAGGGWTHIAKVNGVASSSIKSVNSVLVASIAKLNGVAV